MKKKIFVALAFTLVVGYPASAQYKVGDTYEKDGVKAVAQTTHVRNLQRNHLGREA